jgi:hypothetical protein
MRPDKMIRNDDQIPPRVSRMMLDSKSNGEGTSLTEKR